MADYMFTEEKKIPQIIVIEGETVSVFDVERDAQIGRKTKSNIPEVSLRSDFVSRKHGRIGTDGNGFFYSDTDSTNGSWLNGRKLESGTKYPLSDRDLLVFYKESPIETAPFAAILFCQNGVSRQHRTFADMIVAGYLNQLTFEINRQEERQSKQTTIDQRPLLVEIDNKTVTVKGRKLTLLRDIHLEIPPGSITLILGGSGAGKTTLMNAIMGYEKANGRVRLGDLDVYRDYGEMKRLIGYVPQADLIRMNDTVYDTLLNAASLKHSRGNDSSERKARVEKTLRTLGLERERDHLVRKLSGGQRKRLSVAMEYVSDPVLFFLDEPDSGLDGVMARALFRNLRMIADEGKIVMVISHGPDRHETLFDRVIVLAKSTTDNCGRLAFFGTVQEAYRFFDTKSLEEIVQRINRTDEGGDGLADECIDRFAHINSKKI